MKLSAALAAGAALSCTFVEIGSAQAPSPAASVTMTVNPNRVCTTSRAGSYPNLDLIIDNPGAAERQIEELRALVQDANGTLVERRLLWQQGLNLLGPDRTLRGASKTLIFSPFTFSSDLAGKTVTYELLMSGQTTLVSVSTKPVSCANRYALMLPAVGRLLVYDGFDYFSHHRRGLYDDNWSKEMAITDNFQRFGIDLVMIDAAGRFFTGDGGRTDQWFGWGKPVRAAAAGVVAASHDGQADNVVIGTVDKWTDRPSRSDPMSSYGNYVLIEHAPGEFTLVGHLRNGSVQVKKGERIAAGQQIGAIGNSGASGGVHVHFERRNGFGLSGIQTSPAYFSKMKLIGSAQSPKQAPIAIDSGDVVLAR